MSAYGDLIAFERRTQALMGVAERLSWDQETVMPSAATAQRAEEMAAIEAVLHARRTDPRVGDWLAAVDERRLDEAGSANIRLIRREFDRARRIPTELAAEIARANSLAHNDWVGARAEEDFGAFAPALKRVLDLKRQEAAAVANGGDPYDALLDSYEPGATAAGLAVMFDALRPGLVALAERVSEEAANPPDMLNHKFDEEIQLGLSRELAETFGYDLTRGRIDRAVHPFSSGSGTDVRITTRTDPLDPFNCIYSTIHEVGHGTYEQRISSEYTLTPVGRGASMGVHESQSRIYENQLGRSRGFTAHLYDRMHALFGDFGVANAESFFGTVNRVVPGYIRTEADELHYNLHIMMRFDLERDLIKGGLDVDELPEAWNSRFEADFGLAVDRPSNGVLQDVHWAAGHFGYFPTYTLGNIYAGCLYQALCQDIPDLEECLSRGEVTSALAWLHENLQQHGGLREPVDTVTEACGFTPSVEPLLNYLEHKFSELYRL